MRRALCASFRPGFQREALEKSAAGFDASGKPGGGEIRAFYQNALRLTPAETAALKSNAIACNQALDQQNALAQQAIATARAQNAPEPVTQLAQLEQGRLNIANGCMQSLQSAVSATTFRNIDVFVRSKFGRHVSIVPKGATAPIKPPGGTK